MFVGSGLNRERVREPEADDGFGGDIDVAIAGESGNCGACSGAGEAADEETGSSGRDAADEHAEPAASADERCAALAFSFLGASKAAGLEGIAGSVERHRGEPKLEDRGAFEVSTLMGGGDNATDGGSAGNDDAIVVTNDRLRDLAIEAIASPSGFNAEVLVDADGEGSAGGDLNIGRYDHWIAGSGDWS